tara:strand:+ start:912 stop:1856 length:945 start_codon:yes stop_codon:yes gene_type:complete
MMQAAPEPTTPSTYNHINETELELNIVESKIGDDVKHAPKFTSSGFNVYLTLPAFKTLYSQLGTDGDGLGDKEKFNKPIEQACATLTLVQGAPKKVLRGGNTILTEQQQALDKLRAQMTQMVEAAFDSDKVKCAGKDKARKKAKQQLKAEGNKKPSSEEIDKIARELYIQEAHHSGIREMEWTDNGEPQEGIAIKAKRKVRGVRYVTEKDENGNEIKKRTLVPTELMFHKPHIDGNYYEYKFGDYVPRGTLLAPRVRLEYFSTPMMYGTTVKMDQDVRILWMPKKQVKRKVASAMTYFSDGEDDEESNKRARVE